MNNDRRMKDRKDIADIFARSAIRLGTPPIKPSSDDDWPAQRVYELQSGPIGMSKLHTDGYTKDIGELPKGVEP
jgi:hypothetical protein